jgi:hypothetical protein
VPWRFSDAGRRSAWIARHAGIRKPAQQETHAPQQLPAVLNKKRKGEPMRTAVKQRGNLFNPSAIV